MALQTAQSDSATTVATLEEKVASYEVEIASLKKQVATLNGKRGTTNENVEDAKEEDPITEKDATGTYSGKEKAFAGTYQLANLKGKLRFKGERYNAKELVKNADAFNWLIETNSPLIKKVS